MREEVYWSDSHSGVTDTVYCDRAFKRNIVSQAFLGSRFLYRLIVEPIVRGPELGLALLATPGLGSSHIDRLHLHLSHLSTAIRTLVHSSPHSAWPRKCNQQFSSMEARASIASDSNPQQGFYQCGDCKRSYTRVDHLARHVRSRP